MEQQLVPAEQWRGFAEDFSRLHEGQQVTIDVVDSQGESQHIAQNLPLMGMAIDSAGTRPSSIEIAVGDTTAGLITHVIDLPMAITLETVQERDIALLIEPARGPKTVLLLGGEIQ